MNGLETAFFYLAIGLAIFLPLSIFKLFMPESYARMLIKRNHMEIDKLLRHTPFLIKDLRLATWMSLLCLVPVPVTFHYYLDVNPSITFTFFALMFVISFMEYRYEKWLYQYLTKLKSCS